jgi:archaellum component FlaC
MERTKYTDAGLDTRVKAIEKEFTGLSSQTNALRREMRAGFSEVRGEIEGVRADVRGVRADLAAFRSQMMWLVGFPAVSLVSLLGVAVLQQ